MIGIYSDAGTRLAMAYNGLTVNSEDIYPVGIVTVDHRYDAVSDPRPQDDGMESYSPRRLSTVFRVEGIVKADSVAMLHDRIEALNEAFDPVVAADQDDDFGFLPFTFSVPTEDTDNYATGFKLMQCFVRSIEIPVPRISKFEGDGARFSLMLQAKDPRRYLQSESSMSLSSGSNTVDNSLAGYPSYPRFTFSMTGAGDAAFRIEFPSDEEGRDLQLNLSGLSNGDDVEVDFATRQIYLNGAVDMDLYDAGQWGKLHPRSQTVTLVSTTATSARTLHWFRAFV